MRILNFKKFNEDSKEDIELELENILSHLIDDNNLDNSLGVYVNENMYSYGVYLSYSELINWEYCKNDIIQCLQYISKKYGIYEIYKSIDLNEVGLFDIRFSVVNNDYDSYLYKNIEELEDISNDFEFWEIHFKIKK